MFQGKCKAVDAAALRTWAEEGLALFPDGSPESDEFPADPVINGKIVLYTGGDIASLKIDAIVCPANAQLMPGGGVCGVIHMLAGPGLAEECKAFARVVPGTAIVTGGHNLSAAKVIHAVGPMERDPITLEATYKAVLSHVGDEIRSVAVSPISAGMSGFAIEEAVEISLEQIRRFLDGAWNTVDRIVVVPDGSEQEAIYRSLMPKYFPVALPAVMESLMQDDGILIEEEEEEEEDVVEPSPLAP